MILQKLIAFFKKFFKRRAVKRSKKKPQKKQKRRTRIRTRRRIRTQPLSRKNSSSLACRRSRRVGLKSTKRRGALKRRPRFCPAPREEFLGEITHYFPKVRAAVVKLKKRVELGMPIRIKGCKTDFRQTVGSLQIDRKPVSSAGAPFEVGLEVLREVMPGDKVYPATKDGAYLSE